MAMVNMIRKLWGRFKYEWHRIEYERLCFRYQLIGAICGFVIIALAVVMRTTEFNDGYLLIAITLLLVAMGACYVASFVYKDVDYHEKRLSEEK